MGSHLQRASSSIVRLHECGGSSFNQTLEMIRVAVGHGTQDVSYVQGLPITVPPLLGHFFGLTSWGRSLVWLD